MSNLSPSLRAALAFGALLSVVVFLAALVLLADRWQSFERSVDERLAATTDGLATTLAFDPRQASDLSNKLARLTDESDLAGVAVFDRQGRLLAASDAERLEGLQWGQVLTTPLGERREVMWDESAYLLVAAPIPGSDRYVAVLQSKEAVMQAFWPLGVRTGGILLLLLLLSLAGLALSMLRADAYAVRQMQDLSGHLTRADADNPAQTEGAIGQARAALGPYVAPFTSLVGIIGEARVRVREAREAVTEARGHAAALLQINPHYVLVCTLDGEIVDANPAFYAITGLAFENIRGRRIEVLEEVMPIEPLFDLARRSARENSSIGGIDYAIIDRDDTRRPVTVSLRAVRVGNKDGVIIQATDVATQRELERQIATFSDVLDLMVDQRVNQLTAGSASLGLLLDEAGAVLATFDEKGSTRRWSAGARSLTGRPLPAVPHLTAFLQALGLEDEKAQAFADWFWSPSTASFATETHKGGGPPRRVLWRKSGMNDESEANGPVRLRVLVGLEQGRAAKGELDVEEEPDVA